MHIAPNSRMNLPANQIKYEVEDDLDVDFFAALKSMQQSQPQSQPESQPESQPHEQPDQSHENTCLITNDQLNAFHVTLTCGHKFNYEPLYQEVLRQKGRFGTHNYYEKIGIHQIKCPYCRTFTNQLLPYIGPHRTIKRLNGVNAPVSMCMSGVECSHNNNSSCGANAFYEHDSNPYCLRHYNSVIKSVHKHKHAKNDPILPANQVQCSAEIQTGKNKGNQCALNAIQSDSVPHLCKKHSKCNVVVYESMT
jgi:hypothetical protein